MNLRRHSLFGALVYCTVVAACGDDATTPTPPPPADPDAPAAPTGVSASATGADVTVTWSGSGDSFIVQRQTAGSAFQQVGTATTTRYVDAGLEPGSYSYRVIAVAGNLQSDPSDPALVEVQGQFQVLTGQIRDRRILSADTVYLLRSLVTVGDGGELHIPAGTTLMGDITTQPTALIVRTGGKLFSEGTADNPVVFTSNAVEGERRAGDWGGVILNGRSLCNFPAGSCIGEGGAGSYGGDIRDDNSGRIVYTRIEFAGFEVSFGNELNALTLNGVGSGTEIHHVQTNVGLDDGIELFGGTVDIKYALVTNASDDSFDYSTGWQGRGQFWIVQQNPDDADNGFEVDGNEDDPLATPLTNPMIYNVTLVGGGSGATDGADGLRLRRGTAGVIANAVVVGFPDHGLDIDDVQTFEQGLEIRNSILSSNAASFDEVQGTNGGYSVEAFFKTAAWANRVEADAMMVDPFNRQAPDFTPMAGSPLLTGAATPPMDGFFTETDFIGAADPDGDKWWTGWTSFITN